jgi:hypothetical protein
MIRILQLFTLLHMVHQSSDLWLTKHPLKALTLMVATQNKYLFVFACGLVEAIVQQPLYVFPSFTQKSLCVAEGLSRAP